MALTEQEEFELLSLERERALTAQTAKVPFRFPSTGFAPLDIGLQSTMSPETAAQIGRPILEQGGFLAGEMGGTALSPGAGTVTGAGMGQGTGRVAADVYEALMTGKRIPDRGEMVQRFGSGAASGSTAALAGLGISKAIKGASKLKEALSGVESARFEKLAKNPKAILPSWLGGPKTIKEAGKVLGEAEQAVGIPEPSVADLLKFKKTGLSKAGIEELELIEGAVKEGIKPGVFSTQEIVSNIKRLDKIIKSESSQEFSQLSNRASALRRALVEELAKSDPKLAAAREAYHQAALHREFTEPAGGLLPKNKGGTISRLARYFVPGVIGGAMGLASRNPAQGVGYGVGTMAAESPLALGALTALGSSTGAGLGLPISLGLSQLTKNRKKAKKK